MRVPFPLFLSLIGISTVQGSLSWPAGSNQESNSAFKESKEARELQASPCTDCYVKLEHFNPAVGEDYFVADFYQNEACGEADYLSWIGIYDCDVLRDPTYGYAWAEPHVYLWTCYSENENRTCQARPSDGVYPPPIMNGSMIFKESTLPTYTKTGVYTWPPNATTGCFIAIWNNHFAGDWSPPPYPLVCESETPTEPPTGPIVTDPPTRGPTRAPRPTTPTPTPGPTPRPTKPTPGSPPPTAKPTKPTPGPPPTAKPTPSPPGKGKSKGGKGGKGESKGGKSKGGSGSKGGKNKGGSGSKGGKSKGGDGKGDEPGPTPTEKPTPGGKGGKGEGKSKGGPGKGGDMSYDYSKGKSKGGKSKGGEPGAGKSKGGSSDYYR